MLSPRVWMLAILCWVDYAASFAPPPVARDTSGRAVCGGVRPLPSPATRRQQQRQWPAGWCGSTKKGGQEPVVRFISLDTGEEKIQDPTVVSASRLDTATRDNYAKDDGIIDVHVAKEETSAFPGTTDFDVVVVGGGCAGIGTALMLTRTFGLDTTRVLVVEQGDQVGESFRRWPEEMRFISPSFNQQGWTGCFDLNAIHYDTSPAFLLRSEHPTGDEYANYLAAVAAQGQLQVLLGTQVRSIRDVGTKEDDTHPGPFHVELSCPNNGDDHSGAATTIQHKSTRYIVWAAGEFQHPRDQERPPKDAGSAAAPGRAATSRPQERAVSRRRTVPAQLQRAIVGNTTRRGLPHYRRLRKWHRCRDPPGPRGEEVPRAGLDTMLEFKDGRSLLRIGPIYVRSFAARPVP